MGPYLFATAILVGFFAFGAIYHVILWSQARRDVTLLSFALLCLVSAVNSYATFTLAGAGTVAEAQRALDLRGWAASGSVVVLTWLFALIAGVGARWFVWPITVILTAMTVRGLLGTALMGQVTEVRRMVAPWGEMLTVPERGPGSPLLMVAYGLALAVPIFGLWCAVRLGSRDRIGAWLLATAAVALIGSSVVGLSADILGSSFPYLGPLVAALWILPIAWQVARANQRRDDALRQSEARFRFLIQHQAEFVVSCGRDGRLTFVNDSFSRFFGLPPERAVGASLFDLFPADERASLARCIAELTAANPVTSGEWKAIDRNGHERWTQWTLSGAFDHEPAVQLLQLTGRDIHDRIMAEQAKDQLERQLLQAQKLEALGQLAAGVAHDFNNLLTVIAAHTELLLTGDTDPALHDELTQIQLAAERAAAMTRQLLAFGRQSVLEPRVIDVNAVVGHAAAMLRRTIGENIELAVRTTPSSLRVRADPDQLVRVLLNLAINARDAMPGGGRLVIETGRATFPTGPERPAAALGGEQVLIAVRDSGIGMSAEVKSKLFEPFFTTKGHGKGTGLGLAVVDGIIKQSGGWIDVDTAPGAGTTFRIYLPAVERAVEAEPPADLPTAQTRGREVVLLVEDQTAVREVTVAALERRGYTVLPAASGTEALDIVRSRPEPIDLVLTDVVMPGMSGPQLVEALRADRAGLPAVFMSGYAADAAARPTASGRTGFIQKPFTAATLGAKLRQVLGPT